MALKGTRKSNKNPPIFSHEFVIQNHADIISCIAIVFVLGLMFQTTTPLASMFITLQHNLTSLEDTVSGSATEMMYTNGYKDRYSIFFYSLICIIIHAIIQEYILDKLNRRLHLSKTKHSKFVESGQMLIFTLFSTCWALHILIKDNLLPEISALWTGYPETHAEMSFSLKYFFIVQLSYWIHSYPELYFQKVKKDEIKTKVIHSSLYLAYISGAYLLNFTRIGLILLVLRYAEDFIYHSSRLAYFAEKMNVANPGFKIWNCLFFVCRLSSIVLSLLTFHYGLATIDNQVVDFKTGNFNVPYIRISVLVASCLIQAWLMLNFIHFHLKKMREKQASVAAQKKKIAEKKSKKTKKVSEDDDLPEVDQNIRRRARS